MANIKWESTDLLADLLAELRAELRALLDIGPMILNYYC